MGKALVTGAAGFIGSHLVERLLAEGRDVVGIDPVPAAVYPRGPENLRHALEDPAFRLVQEDILEADLAPLLDGATEVYHLAARPGVRKSWGAAFHDYTRNNVDATQRLLEAARSHGALERFVLASTSSVYGEGTGPLRESGPTRPVSPYGITKLAAEHLARLYHRQFGVPVVIVRYFSVYGPRQRPDMAFRIFIDQALHGRPVTVFGNGILKRDFTFVDDVVEATWLAARRGQPGETYNVGGGSSISVMEAVSVLAALLGRRLHVELQAQVPPGDMAETRADIEKARRQLGYRPRTDLWHGLKRQLDWQRKRS